MFPEEIWGVELLGVIFWLAVSPSARWYRPFVWCHPSCWAPLHAACILAWRLKCVWDEQKLATCREITMKYWIHDDKDSIMKIHARFNGRIWTFSWCDDTSCYQGQQTQVGTQTPIVPTCLLLVVVGSLGEPKQPMLDGCWVMWWHRWNNKFSFMDDHLIPPSHTVDGSEIPRPTTVWMVLKPCKEWEIYPNSTGERVSFSSGFLVEPSNRNLVSLSRFFA